MFRGNRRLVAAVLAAGAATAAAGPARAQETSDPFSVAFYEDQFEYARTQLGNTAGVLYASGNSGDGNRQALTGFIDGAPFSGVAVAHTYTAAGDVGSYRVSGWADPVGAALPIPLGGSLTLRIDRTRNVATWSLDGSAGGQPVSYTSAPLAVPAGVYQLGGAIPLFKR